MKRTRTNSQQGIGAIVIIAIVAAIALLGLLGYVAYSAMNKDDQDTSEVSDTTEDANTDDDATSETSTPAGEELKGVSLGATRADVEADYGASTSPCITYPDTTIADTGCVYQKDDVLGAGNTLDVGYKDGIVASVVFMDNATDTVQQLTKDGLETVQ